MTEPVGVAGVVAALSVTSDLTRGHPPGEAMRAGLLAVELARRAGLDQAGCTDVYYATLLRFAGCAATSHEMAARFGGNDVLVRARGDLADTARPGEALQLLAGLGAGLGKVRMLTKAIGAQRFHRDGVRADCEVGADLTRRLRLPDGVAQAVLDGFERYDGRGAPVGRAGTDVAEAARFAAVGFTAVMFDAVGAVGAVGAGGSGASGASLAAEMVARWSGRALDPAIAAVFLDAPAELLALAGPDDLWAATVEAEPLPRRTFRDDDALDEALAGFGDAADLKSPWFQGHSRGVGQLARAAAALLGSDERLAHRAGLVHDLGRVAIPTGVWERPGRLRPEEWELVRLHPYHSGRILSRSPALAGLAAVVSRHHERTDGSGYPAGVRTPELEPVAALLAAADALHALGEARPHRGPLDLAAACRALAEMPLDRDAIRAVVAAAGAPPPTLPRLPADLTERELDVLRRLASGRTKREIAAELVISPSTVHTHTVHIYAKCSVSTRAGLAMFAMQHGLTGAADPTRAKIH